MLDFREKYRLSLYDVGISYSYTEAIDLINGLLLNTNSYLCAKFNDWTRPFTREEEASWDIQVAIISSNGGKKFPPRPYTKEKKLSLGNKMPIERAVEAYKVTRQSFTPEEAKLINDEWLKKNKIQQITKE